MKIESLKIREFRGIRSLDLLLSGKTFVVEGPNGVGKSGIVEALEFVLTGDVSRFAGRGRGNTSVGEHGHHINAEPEDAVVEAELILDGMNVTIRRSLKNPRKPEVTPKQAAAKLKWLEEHPEIALSRRQLIELIVQEPGKRSTALLKLLKLDDIEAARKTLTSAVSTALSRQSAAENQRDLALADLTNLLGIEVFTEEDALASVNARRGAAVLPPLAKWPRTGSMVAGDPASRSDSGNKALVLRALDRVDELLPSPEPAELQELSRYLDSLADDARLEKLVTNQSLFETGLALITTDECPLCDQSWDQATLRRHLQGKLEQAADAGRLLARMTALGTSLRREIGALATRIEEVMVAVRGLLPDAAASIESWHKTLVHLSAELLEHAPTRWNAERVRCCKSMPAEAAAALRTVRTLAEALPDASKEDAARDELRDIGALRDALERANRVVANATALHVKAKKAKTLFDKVSSAHLDRLYSGVRSDLERFYRFINNEDEGQFTATFDIEPGKLEIGVAFHGEGSHPPAAYHSEGHQDGMGLSLYLALMKQLYGKGFTFCLLDDVVMSVDRNHRKKICELLLKEFPDTQFVVTTHDEVWLHQMIRSKLVEKKSIVQICGWTLEHGPRVRDYKDAWEIIDQRLQEGAVPTAAFELRRHLEFAFAELCEDLAAPVRYRRDATHDLGDLYDAAVARFAKLLKRAKECAVSWRKKGEEEGLNELTSRFSVKLTSIAENAWAVNTLVHNNDWAASMTVHDFAPAVTAYRELLDEMSCSTCGPMYVSMNGRLKDSLRCLCSTRSFNLKHANDAV